MKTRMLLGLIIFGIAASAVALSVQAHAQSPDHSKAMALQTAPGQFVTPTALRGADVKPKHDAEYWEKATAGFDFSDADRVPPDKFNRVLWKGLMGSKRYPVLKGLKATDDRDD